MIESKFLEYIKSAFLEHDIPFEVQKEGTHGPHWWIILLVNDYEVNISGDIAFSINITQGDYTIKLWRIERSLVGNHNSNFDNLNLQLKALFELIN